MRTKMYLHSSKEDNYQLAEELGLSETATAGFRGALYEVEFDVEVDESTGATTIIAVDGKALLTVMHQGKGGA